MLKLFVDDIRQITDDWIVARTVTEAIRLLDTLDIEMVSLDHDIACMTNTPYHQCEHASRETFEAVARFIANMSEERRPKKVFVHTSNSPAGKRMCEILSGKVAEVELDSTHGECWNRPIQ